MIKKIIKALLFAFCSFVLFCGCSGPTEPTLSRDTSPVETALFSELATAKKITAAAEEVLAGMHFEIDKIDSETGYIKTRPLEGAQFFEFWRSDNVGAQNWLLGNLHSVRRTVELKLVLHKESQGLSEVEGFDKYIECVAHVQRLSMPEQHVTSSARAYELFSRSAPVLQTLRLNPEQQKKLAWIDLGNDTELETEIVKRIETKILTSE